MEKEKDRGLKASKHYWTYERIIEYFEDMVTYQINHNGLHFAIHTDTPDKARRVQHIVQFKEDVWITLEERYEEGYYDLEAGTYMYMNMYKGKDSLAIQLGSWFEAFGAYVSNNFAGLQALSEARGKRQERIDRARQSSVITNPKIIDFFIRRIKSVKGFTRGDVQIKELLENEGCDRAGSKRSFRIEFTRNGVPYIWSWDFN